MEFLSVLIILVISYIFIRSIFNINMKQLKEIGTDEKLDKIVEKYPENIDVCKEYLKKLKNDNVKVEENKNSNTTLYLILNNKILISDLKQSYTRIQTIAHECLHSIQDKKILWSNFIFSNIYLIYFIIIVILGIFQILKHKMLFLSISILLGMIYYVIRVYLENDAMIKARYLAKEYMEEKNISTKNEIDSVINKYDELNNIGIKCVNFQLFSSTIVKNIIICIIFFLR